MLSAICLVNYFESGRLPEDRAVLYRLCVEGLLHHWDQRRGIRSEFTLEEKLRTCRNVALAMQSQDRAEYPFEEVDMLFGETLGNSSRGRQLLEYIRFRTGLLLERRPRVFAFAHLTFQEYLAACAVYEGNQLGLDCRRLAVEHVDSRWKEVIALYCGLSTDETAREMLERLLAQPSTAQLAAVLAEAYLSTKPNLLQDSKLRKRVIERVAGLPSIGHLEGFSQHEVAPIANHVVGTMDYEEHLCEACFWLQIHPNYLNFSVLLKKLTDWRTLAPKPLSELLYLMHAFGPNDLLEIIAEECTKGLYMKPGPRFNRAEEYSTQAEIALLALNQRSLDPEVELLYKKALQVLATPGLNKHARIKLYLIFKSLDRFPLPSKNEDRAVWAEVVTRIAAIEREKAGTARDTNIEFLDRWVAALNMKPKQHPRNRSKSGKHKKHER